MFRATIAHIIPSQFRFIPAIVAVCLAFPVVFMEEKPSNIYVWFGIFIIWAISFLSYNKGFLLNTVTLEYKIYTGFWGLKFGKWTPLTHIHQIYVYRTSNSYDASFRGYFSYGSISSTSVLVVLFTEDEKKIPVASTGGKNQSLKIAKKLQSLINVTICDHTGRERVYI